VSRIFDFKPVFILMRSISSQAMEPPFTQPTPTTRIDADVVATPMISPRRPSAGWLRNPAWIGMFLL